VPVPEPYHPGFVHMVCGHPSPVRRAPLVTKGDKEVLPVTAHTQVSHVMCADVADHLSPGRCAHICEGQ
jgi:hypothetical protein